MASTTAKRSGFNMHQRERIAGYMFVSPWVFGFIVFMLGPLIASVAISFYKWDLLQSPEFVGFDNYRRLFTDPLFSQSLKVTFLYGAGRVPLGIITGLAAAILLNQNVRFIGMWRMIYYMPVVLPPVAVSLLWMWIYNPQYGIVNGMLWDLFKIKGPGWLQSTTWVLPALMVMGVWGALGRNMLIYLSGLQSISQELYGAAEIDGANVWHRFRYITLPLLSPIIYFNLITGLIDTFKLFTQAYVMTQGGPRNASLFIYYYLFQNAFQRFKMGYASAMGVVLTLIILAITLLVIRSSKAFVYYDGELTQGED